MGNREKNFISAVIYIHNSENRVEQFLTTIIEIIESNFENSEIICVNDHSDDTSIAIIKKVSQTVKNTTVSVLNMSYFHGLEMAMKAGCDLAIGDFVMEFDSTIQDFDKEQIMKIYYKALEGYDIVSASSDKKQRFTSRIFYHVFGKFTKLSNEIYSESFRILSRRVINRVDSMNKSVPYRKAAYANCGLEIENIRYKSKEYRGGGIIPDKKESKYRTRLAIDTLILFTEVGYKFSMSMTIAMMLVTIGMVLYSLAIYLTSTPVAGWTTTILFMSFAFLGLFGILTVIIKYLQILVDLVFKKRQYSFKSIDKLTK